MGRYGGTKLAWGTGEGFLWGNGKGLIRCSRTGDTVHTVILCKTPGFFFLCICLGLSTGLLLKHDEE